ncbi:MAG: hypothetical protein FJ306_02345, partial [Planctomycetes bacterium]|nr:hypothetical protein [Planctomycetota bacterium]
MAALPPRHEGSRRRDAARLLGAVALPPAAIAAALALIVAATPTAAPDAPAASAPHDAPPAAAAAGAAPAAPTLPREAAPPATTQPPAASFDEAVAELVAIGQRTAAFAQDDDHAAASASDQLARARFAALMAGFPDAGEQALRRLVAAATPLAHGLVQGRDFVLQLVVVAECARRADDADDGGARAPLEHFVHDVLAAMPASPAMAAVGARALVRQPHLRLAHESAVLGLVELAGAEQFPREVATGLLLTLWDNLERHGERSSDALAALALLLLDGKDGSQRAAACRHLLREARYRALVVDALRRSADRGFVREVASLVASDLPVDDALGVLADLGPALGRAPHAYLVCGHRAPDAVADAYRRLLADDVQPERRVDLVAGVGMVRSPTGLDVARTALAHDRSPEVRLQAVFALTANADPETAMAALLQAADDVELTAARTRCDGL